MMVEYDEASRLTPSGSQGPTNEAFRVVGLPDEGLGQKREEEDAGLVIRVKGVEQDMRT
jgi:hypothetical protein